MSAVVAFAACTGYDREAVCEAVEKLIGFAPPPDVRDKTVLLKPNILSPKRPETAVCTHPSVVYAAVKAFLRRGAAAVLVGESPAVAGSRTAAKVSGIYDAVSEAGGTWVDFEGAVDVPCPEGKFVRNFTFAEAFTRADMIVTLPKLKTHQLMAYTGAMKNLFGLMVGLNKAQIHFRFPERKDFSAFLTDLTIAAKPVYGIMDSVTAMEGPGGPGNGKPVQINVLAASCNVLALDWACASLVGYNPENIQNLADAMERRIWLSSAEEIEFAGDPFEELKPRRFDIVRKMRGTALLKPYMPKFFHKFASIIFVLWPVFSRRKCIRCGRCIEICPAKALYFSPGTGQRKKVKLRKERCLHCFCCHEVCPEDAIRLRRKL
ncbi:MAG: DUF362 domain-containing protein [Spirochaetaceae bacterium]|jgi:uncharacterized protein (DUF362 family)/Pyruvate/2-oxoacid:ferredoxin oxidoreductase delta subunit|nr:DUF362 domain-containing protein [Spirochaetaceae bacterium]